MPDIFDFLSTRTDPAAHTPLDVTQPISIEHISLTPSVPANVRTDSTNTDLKATLDNIAAKIAKLPSSAPAYEIGNKEAKRYSNPFMQTTPGYDMEDIYGIRQSGWSKVGNALVKTGINFGSTFVSHFATMPHTLDLLRSGKYLDAFKDDSIFSYAQEWITNAEDEFPNYYTAWEREHPFLSAIPFSGGALNFYGDKLIKNIGFSMGALASGLVTDIALEAVTMGTSTPVVVANRLRSLGQMMPRMYRAMRSFNKIATRTDDFKDVMGMSGTAKQMVKNLGTYKGAMDASRFAATSYLTAQTEAHIEGYHNYIDIKARKYEDAIRNNDYNPSTYEAIEKDAQDAARWTTGLNMPIVMASNYFQFKNLLHGRANFGESMKGFIDVDTKDGLQLVNAYSKAKKWKAFGKELGLDMLSEGGQEAGQAITGNVIYDYYASKVSPEARGALLSHILKELPNSVDQGVLEEAFIGALSGGMMGSIGGWNKYTNERTQNIVDQQNRTIEKFQSTAQQIYHQMEIHQATAALSAQPDDIQKMQALKEAKTQALFTTIHDSLYFGTYDMLMDSFNDLRDIDLDDFNQSFDHNFTEAERQGFVDGLVTESKQMKTNVEAVNKAFNKNPFESNVFVSRIKKSFFPAESEIEGIQTKLFNDFKQNMAYSLTRMQKVEGNLFEFDQELTKLGVNPDFLEYIQGDASIFNKKKGASNYMKWKSTFLNTLKDQQKYYDKLSTLNAPDLANSKQEKAKLDTEVQRLEQYIQSINDAIQANDLEKVAQLIEAEEVSSEVLMYDQFRKIIAQREAEMAAAKEMEEAAKNPEKVAEQTLAANEVIQPEVEPAEVGETNILTKPPEWTDEFGGYQGDLLINGRRFKIRAIKDGQLHVVPHGGKEVAIITKQGDVYTMEYGRAPNNVIEEVTIEKVPLEEVPQAEVEAAANAVNGLPSGKGIGMIDPAIPMYYDWTKFETATDLSQDPIYEALKYAGVNVDWFEGKVLAEKGTGRFLFNINNRLMVFAKVGNGIIPIYFSSSGTSGKEITWHPIFGVDSDKDWLIKGHVDAKGQMKLGKRFKPFEANIKILEDFVLEFRKNFNINQDKRDELLDVLAANYKKANPGSKWYQKDNIKTSEIFVNFNVTESMGPDGVNTNDNYTSVVAFALFQIDPTITIPATYTVGEEITTTTTQPVVNTFTLDQIKQASPGMIFYEEGKPSVGYTMREIDEKKVLTRVAIKGDTVKEHRYHIVRTDPSGPFLQLEGINFVPLELEQKADVLEIDEVGEFLGRSKGRDYKNLKALMTNGDIDIECN